VDAEPSGSRASFVQRQAIDKGAALHIEDRQILSGLVVGAAVRHEHAARG
jgi:hypothetical protein